MKECVWWCWMITPVPGAVKITPAHDPNDYDVGMRLKLPFLTIITNDGNITKDCGEFAVSGCCCIVTTEIFSDEHLPYLPCEPSDEHLPYWPSNEHLPCQPSDEHLPCQPQESWSSLNKKSWSLAAMSWIFLMEAEWPWIILKFHAWFIVFSVHCAAIDFSWEYRVQWFIFAQNIVQWFCFLGTLCRDFFSSEDLVQWLSFLIIMDFFSEYLVLHALLCMWHTDLCWAFPVKLVCSCCVRSWPGRHLSIRS